MRGEITRGSLPVGSRDSAPAHDLHHFLKSVLEAVVDDLLVELVVGLELALRGLQAAGHLAGVIRPPAREPGPQRVERRRSDEHLHGLGEGLADLAGALDLDLEDHGHAGVDPAAQLGAQGAVAAAGVLGVLDEVPRVHARVELLRGQEVVVDPVLLPRARRPRGRGDRQLELGHAREEVRDQRALAHAGRPGDDEDAGAVTASGSGPAHLRLQARARPAPASRPNAPSGIRPAVGYRRRSRSTSSVRWRCESPPMVLLGEMRHTLRILFTFTRPYFGTASSMSNTLAVST